MSRSIDDLPPMASDDELVEWGKELVAEKPRPSGRPNRPLVATRISAKVSTEELLLDISDRAQRVYKVRRRVNARQ